MRLADFALYKNFLICNRGMQRGLGSVYKMSVGGILAAGGNMGGAQSSEARLPERV